MDEIKTSVFRRGTRSKTVKLQDGTSKEYKIKGGWVYRLRYIDDDAKPCTVEKGIFERKSEAKDAMNVAKANLVASGGRSQKNKRKTFADLAETCAKDIFRPARFVTNVDGGLERAYGLRSWKSVRSEVGNLTTFFGNRL